MSGVNDTLFLVQNETCGCTWGLNKIIYNSKQKWNHD